MAYFDSVNPKADFPKMERELLEHWYKDGIVKKYLNKSKKVTTSGTILKLLTSEL